MVFYLQMLLPKLIQVPVVVGILFVSVELLSIGCCFALKLLKILIIKADFFRFVQKFAFDILTAFKFTHLTFNQI